MTGETPDDPLTPEDIEPTIAESDQQRSIEIGIDPDQPEDQQADIREAKERMTREAHERAGIADPYADADDDDGEDEVVEDDADDEDDDTDVRR